MIFIPMDYIQLPDLQNTYPDFTKYKYASDVKSILFGNYQDRNKVEFTLPKILESCQIVNGTTFRFILEVKLNKDDSDPKYFISRSFYRDIKDSITTGNPFLPLLGLSEKYIVRINVQDTLDLVLKLKKPEEEDLVNVLRNVFIDNENLELVSSPNTQTQIQNPSEEIKRKIKEAALNLNKVTEALRNFRGGTFGDLTRFEDKKRQLEAEIARLEEELKKVEKTNTASNNVYSNAKKAVNYELLAKYIDWITLPNEYSIDTVETGGVIEANKLGIWTGEFIVSGSAGTSGKSGAPIGGKDGSGTSTGGKDGGGQSGGGNPSGGSGQVGGGRGSGGTIGVRNTFTGEINYYDNGSGGIRSTPQQ